MLRCMHSRHPYRSGIACCVVMLALWVVAGAVDAQPAEPSAELAARIERLIVQLDDDSFDVREQAQASLIEIGLPALAKVTAAAKDASAERSQRAATALKSIRQAKVGLKYVGQARHDTLNGAVVLRLSPDGKFVYVTGSRASAINVFRRDPASGALTLQQALVDPEQLGGICPLRFSSDGKYAIAACHVSKTVSLLSRSETTGELKVESVYRCKPGGEVKMQLPIEATFSPDDKFVYVGDTSLGTVLVFKVEPDKGLTYVHTLEPEPRMFAGVLGLVAHPDGKTLYVCSYRASTLTVLDRDAATGKVSVRQVLKDEEGGIHGLGGIIDACVSRDGKHVYTAAGRWNGDHAIGVYLVGMDGKLVLLQEFINDKSDLVNFVGGGKGLAISPDGKLLYVSGVLSGSLACFDRDPASGKLAFLATLHNETTGKGLELGAHGVEVSPDGKFLYLALELGNAVSVFERSIAKTKP